MNDEMIEDAEIVETTELVVRQPTQEIVHANLFGVEDPVEVVERAARVATALSGVIKSRGLTKRIRDKDHVLVEGWQLLGSMLGVFPVLELCEPVERRGVEGYRAVIVCQTRDGSIVGRAEALCMRDETKWKTADEYAVASMAQTRATSKALKGPLGFVMKLAGYETTPAEEMDFASRQEPVESVQDKAPVIGALNAEMERLKDADGWTLEEVIGAARRSFKKPRIMQLSDMTVNELEQILEAARGVRA